MATLLYVCSARQAVKAEGDSYYVAGRPLRELLLRIEYCREYGVQRIIVKSRVEPSLITAIMMVTCTCMYE